MATVCTFPPRYVTGISNNPRIKAASLILAEMLENSNEFSEFVRLGEAVNSDLDVYALVQEIRSRRESFGQAESAGLEAKLESLPVMAAYRASERALRALFAEVDAEISLAAGLGFCEHVRPQGHG
jgi:cell fate (sporulation/competence/biofilm development) regulator YlbF (YheA/YmcA/DUF963 family)